MWRKVAAPAVFICGAAGAAASPEAEPVRLDGLQVTAGRRAETQFEVPQAVSTVDREAIARATPRLVTDVLRGQPGVFVQSSGPGQGIPILRGLKGSEVLHLVDGMRLNMSFFRNAPSQYLGLVDPNNLQQVEVLRGPAATLYGSDAMGGVVHLLTPEQRFSSPEWQARGQALWQWGSADLRRLGRLQGAMGNDRLSLAGGVTGVQYGQLDLGEGGREPYTAYRAGGGDVKLLWSPALGHEVMLSGQAFTVPRLPRYHEFMAGPGGCSSNCGLPVFFEPNRRAFLHLRHRWQNGNRLLESVEVNLARQIIDDDRQRYIGDASTLEQEANRSALTGLTVRLRSPLPKGGLVYGVDVYRDHVRSARWQDDLDDGTTLDLGSSYPDGAEERSTGVYVSGDWRPQRRWLVEAGVRYSHIQTHLPATAASAPAELENDDLTGHVSTAFGITPEWRWTMNLARGFRTPNLFDLGTLGRRAGSTPEQINLPNPQLRPERILSVDTGLKWQNSAVALEMHLFHARYADRIEGREPAGPANAIPFGMYGCSEADGCDPVHSLNIARAEYSGMEFGARFTPDPRFEGYVTLNYVHGEETQHGVSGPANRVPPLNGQVGLVWRPVPGWFVEPYLLFADEQQRLDDDDLRDVRIAPGGTPGWGASHLRGGWAGQRQRVELSLHNLGDRAYREHGSGIAATGFGAVLTLRTAFGDPR